MEVKTNVFLSEADIRVIIKKHLEKQSYKVIGELEVIVKKSPKGNDIQIRAEVQKQFKNRISLPKNP
jgi:hypothetical protein|tara:strand:- start:535 stop:735 length:201 start_codon:yes stop_codon:yes gene_type:complete